MVRLSEIVQRVVEHFQVIVMDTYDTKLLIHRTEILSAETIYEENVPERRQHTDRTARRDELLSDDGGGNRCPHRTGPYYQAAAPFGTLWIYQRIPEIRSPD